MFGERWGKVEYFLVNFLEKLMFIGEYNYNLDDKGRLAVPVKFREKIKKGAIVTRGLDNCLFLYAKEEWEKIVEKLSNLPVSQSKARAFSRLMLAGAMEVDCDSQGRINLPDYLRKFAKLDKKTVIAGLFNRLEIWDEKFWEDYKKRVEKDSNEIAEELEI